MNKNPITVDETLKHAKQAVSLFERKMITEATLVNDIVRLITPENIDSVTESLPSDVRGLIVDWAKSLTFEDSKEIVFWPLNQAVRRSFQNWLQQQQQQANGK